MPEHGTYLGNPLLKSAHVAQDWTEEGLTLDIEDTEGENTRKNTKLLDDQSPIEGLNKKDDFTSAIDLLNVPA